MIFVKTIRSNDGSGCVSIDLYMKRGTTEFCETNLELNNKHSIALPKDPITYLLLTYLNSEYLVIGATYLVRNAYLLDSNYVTCANGKIISYNTKRIFM